MIENNKVYLTLETQINRLKSIFHADNKCKFIHPKEIYNVANISKSVRFNKIYVLDKKCYVEMDQVYLALEVFWRFIQILYLDKRKFIQTGFKYIIVAILHNSNFKKKINLDAITRIKKLSKNVKDIKIKNKTLKYTHTHTHTHTHREREREREREKLRRYKKKIIFSKKMFD